VPVIFIGSVQVVLIVMELRLHRISYPAIFS